MAAPSPPETVLILSGIASADFTLFYMVLLLFSPSSSSFAPFPLGSRFALSNTVIKWSLKFSSLFRMLRNYIMPEPHFVHLKDFLEQFVFLLSNFKMWFRSIWLKEIFKKFFNVLSPNWCSWAAGNDLFLTAGQWDPCFGGGAGRPWARWKDISQRMVFSRLDLRYLKVWFPGWTQPW
jgi:hypothetical protein